MGRSPRIEFNGAVYHVMSRGNRQDAVFLDDQDNRMFLDTLEEACSRTGWRVHAFVLMGNHYHLLLETPEANLVDGMRWVQGTYTKRFNIRHKQWGHLFQGRYKALVVEPDGTYFQTLGNYIHLNPARTKSFDLQNGTLEHYLWSSYPLYLKPAKRPEWLEVNRVLGSLGLSDDRSGRERYRHYMKKRISEMACSDKPWEIDEQWSMIRRGWCLGSDEFREQMVDILDSVIDGKRRDSFVGKEIQKHDIHAAERLFKEGIKKLGINESDLSNLKKSDPRKKAIAWLIRKRTSVRNEWISKRMLMGSVSKLSLYVKEVEDSKYGDLYKLKNRVKR